MAVAPKRALKEVPVTSNFTAIVAALGNAARNVRYDNGVLYVDGVDQAALDAAADAADPVFGTRALIKQQAGAQLMGRLAAGMTWAGHPLQIDEASTMRIGQSAQAASLGALPEGFAWRMGDNFNLAMGNEDMIAMATAAFDYVASLRVRYWQIVDQANTADAESLGTINPASGWPTPPA